MIIRSILGLAVFAGIAWLVSENRKKVSIRMVLTGFGLQIVAGVFLLKLPLFGRLFLYLNNVVTALEESTKAGTSAVFGFLGGAPLPYEELIPNSSITLAFRALPLILVISALSAVLFYWKVLPAVVKAFS